VPGELERGLADVSVRGGQDIKGKEKLGGCLTARIKTMGE